MSSQPDRHDVLQDFFRWENQSRVEVMADLATDEKTCFMPLETLKSYFRANGGKRLDKILAELFYPDIPIKPEVILRTHTAVFCILLLISKGRYIEYFSCYEELSDQRLPFDPAHPPACFPVATDDSKFLQRFCETQWRYCVPIFDNHMVHKRFGPQRLLPITHKERLGVRGSAILYKIKIYEPHTKLLPEGSRIQMNNTNPNVFILKRYLTKDAEDHYNREIRGFNTIKHPKSMIGFYGSYIHGGSYNILLEFADKGSLEEYFQHETPPSHGEDIIKFWAHLFELTKALNAIHTDLGWHQNVKPANIHVLSYGAESAFDWEFKLADLGPSNSIKGVPLEGDAMANDSPGTCTYGAPECYMQSSLDDKMGRSPAKISQAVDIWALGCIYSEAAMWIADGYKGVIDYRQQRRAATDKIPNFKGGDCFHDGERMLKAVSSAHAGIELRLRRSDNITKDVLDSMVMEMLWDEDRPNAKALWRKAETILSRAQQRLLLNNTEDGFTRPDQVPRSPAFQRPQPPSVRPVVSPRGLSGDAWREHIRRPSGDLCSPTYSVEPTRSGPESVSEFGSQASSSPLSWQGAGSSLATSPASSTLTSPFSSRHASLQYDFHRQHSNEAKPRPLPNWRSSSQQLPNEMSLRQSFIQPAELPDNGLVSPNERPRAEFTGVALAESEVIDNPFVDDEKTIGPVSRRSSSVYSVPLIGATAQSDSPSYPHYLENFPIPPKSPNRPLMVSFFPQRDYTSQSPSLSLPKPTANTSILPQNPVALSESSSNNPALLMSTDLSGRAHSVEHLSLAEVLEWKKANKKPKKRGGDSTLRGANLLNVLQDRDHVFIIDDGSSMRQQWPAVKEVFEALSYILKPMAPSGIEVFYTVSYDTWRRRDTKELVEKLEAKGVAGDTNISYRLALQLDMYKPKIQPTPRRGSAKSKKVRPMCFYILTDGNWRAGGDPAAVIKGMADSLISADLKNGQVTIQFISFGQNAMGLQRMKGLANADFGLDIVDTTPSTQNVLKMLLGARNKNLFRDCNTSRGSPPATAPQGELE